MRSNRIPSQIPFMVLADAEGNIIEDTRYLAAGRSGNTFVNLKPEDFIELPEGSELFFLPGRIPVGVNVQTGVIEEVEEATAVSAFISPAHTQTYLSAFRKSAGPVLPLYAYTAVGWHDGKFYTTAVRIDPDIRQDVSQFNLHAVKNQVKRMRKKYPGNKLIDHLADNCALNYQCRASQNYFMGRWECPLPVSPACNAECLGCISLQPEEHDIQSSHFRLNFTPAVHEVAQIAIDHIESAPNPIVSFGQGCEGEPLLVWEVMRDVITEIRKHTQKGIINVNSNGSRCDVIQNLCDAGLDSMRVSMNSAQPEWYTAYYNPRNYTFADVVETIRIMRRNNKWVSLNYFVFPGLTDSQQEFDALCTLIEDTRPNMIQWRNFNIDPDFYFKKTGITAPEKVLGVKQMIANIKTRFPFLYHGYFNPAAYIQQEYLTL